MAVPSGAFGLTAPGRRIAIGMVGLGGAGRANLEAFLAMNDVHVRAVCDVREAKMSAAKARVDRYYGDRNCLALRDYREMCARPDLDAVMIAVPDHAHAAVGCAAACAGKDIFGEAPFAHTRREGERLLADVRKHRVVWQTHCPFRTETRFRRAVAAVRTGLLGRVSRVEVGLPGGGRGPERRTAAAEPVPAGLDWEAWQGTSGSRAFTGICDFHWRWVSAWGGGTLADWIGQYGDIALWGVGKDAEDPAAVEGRGVYPRDGLYDTATSFRFEARYRDGLTVAVADGGQMPKGIGVRWTGERDAWVWVTHGALEASSPSLLAAVYGIRLGRCDSLYRDFIVCVRARREPLAPAAAAFHAAGLGHSGEMAMRGRG